MRPIDADMLIKEVESVRAEYGNENLSLINQGEILDLISEQPTVDAAPVVHAHWMKVKDPIFIGMDNDCFMCSHCGTGFRGESVQN